MGIWHAAIPDLDALTRLGQASMPGHLGITFTAVGEDWLEVHTAGGDAAPERGTYDRMVACVAADRAFVDEVTGGSGPEHGPPDYAEALRTHRLATAVARSAASGRPERLS